MGRTYRTSKDEFEAYAQIIADCVSRNCKQLTLFNVQNFKKEIIVYLIGLVEAFEGVIKDTD